jgi:hypothetical protein
VLEAFFTCLGLALRMVVVENWVDELKRLAPTK